MINNNKDTSSKEVLRKVWRYEEMLRSNTKVYFDEDDLLDIAEYYYYDMSKDAEALRCLDYALKLHPESLPVKLRISEIRYFQGETAEAWELLARSGGHPLTVCGEWDGRALRLAGAFVQTES